MAMEKSDSILIQAAGEVENPVNAVKVTDQERELANHAQVEFESKHYDSCLATLNKLAEIRNNDPKVQHNKAVAQYYQSNLLKTDEFSRNLQLVRKQVDRDAEDSRDEVDDVDTATLLYNEAVLQYHLRQYKKAEVYLQRLNKVIEPIDEHLACKIGFLLIEVYLTLWKPDKASGVITYLENLIFGNSKPSEVQQGQGQAAQVAKEVDENLKSKLHQCKARVNILAKSMKACKREIKTVMNNNNMTPEALFLKSNFEYLRQNYRKSIKQLNSAPKDDSAVRETGESISTMYYNNLGCIHFQMHKYNLAAFYFRRALEENDKASMSLPPKDKNNLLSGRPLVTVGLNLRHEILYNLGIQLLFSGRPLAAFDCLVDAVQRYHTNPRLWLRLAECCIMAQNMTEIARYLNGFPVNNLCPQSVDYRQQSIKKSSIVQAVVGSGPHRKIVLSPQDEKKDIIAEQSSVNHSAAMPACTLEFAWICLQNALLLVNSSESTAAEQETAHESGLNKDEEGLGHSVDSEGSGDSSGQGRMSPLPREPSIPAQPGPPVKLRELPHLKCTILGCSSFVALGLGDNVMALKHAQNLLLQSELSGSQRYLGHLYAAEALVRLGRVADAIAHLAPENIADLALLPTAATSTTEQTGQEKSNKDSSVSDREPSKPHGCNKLNFPKTLSEGRAVMLLNLASTYCLRSEYEKARKCLQQALSLGLPSSTSVRAVLLAVYIELQCGNVTGALQMIKKHQVLQFGQQRAAGKLLKKFLI